MNALLLLASFAILPREPYTVQLAAVRIAAAHTRTCRDWPCAWTHAERACRAAEALWRNRRSPAAGMLLGRTLDIATAVAAHDGRGAARASVGVLRACDGVDGGKGRLAE